jgi:hypothetical protein
MIFNSSNRLWQHGASVEWEREIFFDIFI